MKLILHYLILIVLFSICINSQSYFTTTSYPVTMILQEITGIHAEVNTIVPPGVSPHTYALKPSVIRKALSSKAVIYLADEIDIWAADIPDVEKIALFSLLSEEDKIRFQKEKSIDEILGIISRADTNEIKSDSAELDILPFDPHFWTDPITIKKIIPKLVDTLSSIDPLNAANYRINANNFLKRLELLDMRVKKIIMPVSGSFVFLFHPSFNYFLKRYGLIYAGTISHSPSKEITPKALGELIKKVQKSETKAIFSEPQLPDKPAQMIADEANVNLFILDPVGGYKGRQSYEEFILYNAKTFAKALK